MSERGRNQADCETVLLFAVDMLEAMFPSLPAKLWHDKNSMSTAQAWCHNTRQWAKTLDRAPDDPEHDLWRAAMKETREWLAASVVVTPTDRNIDGVVQAATIITRLTITKLEHGERHLNHGSSLEPWLQQFFIRIKRLARTHPELHNQIAEVGEASFKIEPGSWNTFATLYEDWLDVNQALDAVALLKDDPA